MIVIEGKVYDTKELSKVSEEFESIIENNNYDGILWIGDTSGSKKL